MTGSITMLTKNLVICYIWRHCSLPQKKSSFKTKMFSFAFISDYWVLALLIIANHFNTVLTCIVVSPVCNLLDIITVLYHGTLYLEESGFSYTEKLSLSEVVSYALSAYLCCTSYFNGKSNMYIVTLSSINEISPCFYQYIMFSIGDLLLSQCFDVYIPSIFKEK